MTTDQPTPRTTATPRTDAALYPMNGVDIVWPEFARILETELAETERLRFGADADRRQLRCDLFDAKWECEKLKFALVEWEAKERGWSKAVEKDAAELTRLRAELEVANHSIVSSLLYNTLKETNARLRAEVERLTTKIGNQADRIRYLEGAINHATGTPLSKAIARAEKAEAALAFIAENGGTKHETECGTISCNGSWCAEQARAAIDAAMKGTP